MKALLATLVGFGTSSWFNSVSYSTDCTASSIRLSQSKYHPCTLINAYNESHDAKVLRFALPESDMSLNMDVVSYLLLQFVDNDNHEVVQPYTPISRTDQLGYFEILVKKSEESPMGGHLFSLKKDDTINVKGPYVTMLIRPNQYKSIGMIANETGIAPMYHVARNLLRVPKNTTEMSLIYANACKENVLLGNEINELMEAYPSFSPYFVLKDAPLSWMGGLGDVSKEMIKAIMPSPNRAEDSIILVSGSRSFMKEVCGEKKCNQEQSEQGELRGRLRELGYPPKMVFKL
ncbi:unnamed protein product [Phytomonas sp. EM1]|nr:unnamed protein product [Phytomonas sp. EM1]|eukprot:CCW65568.1 unnamed protein product [Phytomonas sp. isolate EM1]